MIRYRRVWIREYKGKRGTTYRVCFYDSEKKARRTIRTFQSKRIARGFRDKYQAYLNGEGPNPAEASEPGAEHHQPKRLWSEAVTEWIESGPTKQTTRSTYRSLLNQFGRRAKVVCVEDVNEAIVSNFLSDLKRRGRSLATCAAYLRTLAAFFAWVNPERSPITKKLISRWTPYKDRKRARPHYYTSEEYEALLAACDSIEVQRAEQRDPLWWKCFIAVLYHAGLRLNEAAHLIWRDIDFERAILKIQPRVRLTGVFEWRPKGKARRAIPVSDEVMNLLIQMQEQQAEGVPYVFLSKTRYLELRRKGCPQRDILCGIGKTFKRIRDAADISEGAIHDMRRTCITNWAKQPGLTPKDVQILAGHSDLNTTLVIYTMTSEDEVVEKTRKLIREGARQQASS